MAWNKNGRKQMFYWLAVMNDEYELPLFVADTVSELAMKFGKDKAYISRVASEKNNIKQRGKVKFVRVSRDESDY